jgi:tRNA-splicing ligase RtcB
MIHTYSQNLIKPIKSWCEQIEDQALEQAKNLANHPATISHIALMPDCHVGYGMPIGGVIACKDALIPNAVGVDIGCGMGAVKTTLKRENMGDKRTIRDILERIKYRVPLGEGHAHKTKQAWEGFELFYDSLGNNTPGWHTPQGSALDARNLGSLGGGNHFIEIQCDRKGAVWIMLHSGSRNLGHRIASWYHKAALEHNAKNHIVLPDTNLAYLPFDEGGREYLRDMNFALDYARESRRRMMSAAKESFADYFEDVEFTEEINIHHNYASLEDHGGRKLWIHRKGATSAQKGELGIIPGSMGTSSYIVRGLGNPESFCSCSHGAGRVMGRGEASRTLKVEECDKAMEGIVFDRWSYAKQWIRGKKRNFLDLSEAPQAYKDINKVIADESDLVEPVVKLQPLGVIKG